MKRNYIGFEETSKVCKLNHLDEKLLNLKGKDKATNAIKIINEKIGDEKQAKPEHVKEYIEKLLQGEFEVIHNICKEKDLDKQIKEDCNYDVQKSIDIINTELSEDKKVISLDAVSEYIKELKFMEIESLCSDENLKIQVEEYNNHFSKIKEAIIAAVSDDKKDLFNAAIDEYILKLKFQAINELCKNSEFKKNIEECKNDFKKITDLINTKLPDDGKIKSEDVQTYFEKLKEEKQPDEKIENEIQKEKDGTAIDTNALKELESLKIGNANLRSEKVNLEIANKKLKEEIERLKQELYGSSKYSNDIFTEIPELNELLDCNDKINVSINKELLSTATKFVDDKSLIKLEGIIRNGSDISSNVVQSILIAFIKQNSLYKFKKEK